MKSLLACIAFASAVLTVGAAPAEKPVLAAGPQPSGEAARQAVIDDLKRKVHEAADFSRVRFFSGPHLVTGVNFAGSMEQAWLMCVVTGNARPGAGSLDLSLQPYLLRTREGGEATVAVANWKDSDIRC